MPTAGTSIGCAYQLEVGAKGQRPLRAADGDHLVLHWLAHHFQDARSELKKFIQKENAAMRQRDFAGVGNVPAADQPGVADRMMRRAERSLADQWHPGRELVGSRTDNLPAFPDLEAFTQGFRLEAAYLGVFHPAQIGPSTYPNYSVFVLLGQREQATLRHTDSLLPKEPAPGSLAGLFSRWGYCGKSIFTIHSTSTRWNDSPLDLPKHQTHASYKIGLNIPSLYIHQD